MNKINIEQFSVDSMVDDFGKVLFWQGRVLRLINTDKIEYCNNLLDSDLFKQLTEKELIPNTIRSNVHFEGYDLVLEHEKLINTKQHEWSYNMFKSAAMALLEVNELCIQHGYQLKDAHTMNVLFKGSKPMLVDIGSIELNSNSGIHWSAYDEFLNSFFVPLLFWSSNKQYLVRKLVESNFHRMVTIPSQSMEDSGIFAALDQYETNNFEFKIRSIVLFGSRKKLFLLNIVRKIWNKLIIITLKDKSLLISYSMPKINLKDKFPEDSIGNTILGLPEPTLNSQWKGYHHTYYSDVQNIKYSNRFHRIVDILKTIPEISSIIDLAGNEGYFALLCSKELDLEQIITIDYDENASSQAFSMFSSIKCNKVTSLLLNFMFTPDLIGTTSRLKSDCAIALAVTHHLLLTDKYSISAIFQRLRMYSSKYVMVEFMPLGLWAIGDKTLPQVPDWYTEKWFRKEFQKVFHLILEEKLETNRILFFGKIIN